MKPLNIIPIASLVFAGIVISGCEGNQGTAEKAGEKMDEAAESVSDSVNEAVEETGEAIEEAGDKVREKTE